MGAPPNYSVRTWQAEDGLPQDAVSAIVQTRDGYIWVGTYSGLARFDGVRFVVFDSSSTPELHSSRVTSLFEARDGSLWIGHEGGEVACMKAGRFQEVQYHGTWTNRAILTIAEDEHGGIWLVNRDGLLINVKDGLVLSPQKGTARGIVLAAGTPQGIIWIARNGIVTALRDGKLTAIEFEDQTRERFVQGIATMNDGGLSVAHNGLLRKWSRGTWSEASRQAPWGFSALTTLRETRNQILVAGTQDKGIFLIYPDDAALQFSRTNRLAGDWVRSVCEDREGNLWVGTDGGLSRLRPTGVASFDPPDHWQYRPVLSVCASRDGALWAGTEGAGLYRLKEGTWSHFGQESGLPSLFIWSIAEDAAGRIWAGTWGAGIVVQSGNIFTRAPGLDLSLGVATPGLLSTRQGALWIGTSIGLARYQAENTQWPTRADNLASPDVRAVVEDTGGVIWFGMYGGGLGCLQDGVVRQFRRAEGLSSDFVQCLHLDEDRALWIGTFGGGLTRLKAGRFAVIDKSHGLPDNVICSIQEDSQGRFWMSSHAGIICASKAGLNRCADGAIHEVRCQSYGTSDGLPTIECSGGLQPAGCKSADGRVWFSTTKGLVVVDPRDISTNFLAPPVMIEGFLVDDKPVTKHQEAGRPLSIPPGRHRFDFQYTGLSYVSPENVRFKYRLDGWEKDWINAGTRRVANYSYIPPGRYAFRVIACNNDGVWNESGAVASFSVLPYFWQTLWFRIAGGILTLCAGGGIVWLDAHRRMRSKLERIERQRSIEEERSRIARDIHDDLGADLTRITMLSESARSELENPERVEEDLSQIYDTARDLTRAMDEIVWAVNPKHDTLESLVTYVEKFAHDFLDTAGVRCRLDMPMHYPSWALTSEVRHNLFLAVKEALNNAVKHASATEVTLSLQVQARAFQLTVQDNGRGFNPATAGDSASSEGGRATSGNGLSNMMRHLHQIDGRCEIRSEPKQGTQVMFHVQVSGLEMVPASAPNTVS